MADSLIVAEQIELIGPGGAAVDALGTPSFNPLCPGAVFRLIAPTAARGGVTWNLGAPQPTTDIVGSLLLDGERPFGYRASNRTITLPVIIKAPTFQSLIAAREVLLQEINQQTWTLRWTRDTLGPLAGTTVDVPLLFDCFRAQPTVYEWGGFYHRIPYGIITLTFQALPYGRSDNATVVDFPSPLSGRPAPPPRLLIDGFASVSGAQWSANPQGPMAGSQSAYWDPSASPANNPPGIGMHPVYSASGLSVNLAAGFASICEGAGSLTQMTVIQQDAANMSIGDIFQLCGNSLSGNDTGFETGYGSWYNYQNCAIASTTAQAHTGTHSLSLTSAASGAMAAARGASLPCLPNDTVFVSAWFRSQASSRTCQVGALWLDANSNPIGSPSYTGFLGASASDNSSGWVQATAQVTAPAGTAGVQPVAQVLGTGTPPEVHYIDDVVLSGRASPTLQSQFFTITSIGQPSLGFQAVQFSPAAASLTSTGTAAVQVSPPQRVSLSFWAGFGSSLYYKEWARLGGRVTFAFTLTDTYGTTLSFSKSATCAGSTRSESPRWHKISVPVPYNPAFDYENVTGYSLSVTNRGSGALRWTQFYVSNLYANPHPVSVVPVQRGAVYEMAAVGSARAAVSLHFQQPGVTAVGKIYTTPGTYYWLCPAGVTTLAAFNIGAGGGGAPLQANGGGGGGGGGSANNAAVAVTPGNVYQVVVGSGGRPGSSDGGNSTFTGDAVTVTAYGGKTATAQAGGAGGTAGTGGYAGGAGGTGVASGSGGGGGGGGSGGSAAAGNTGGNASGSTGGAGATAVTNGGPGGKGGTFGHGNGLTPGVYGGGSGGSPGGATGYAYPGANGMVSLSYYQTKQFQSLLVHRPPVTAPLSLSPVQPVSVGDPADGTAVYRLSPIGDNLNARFAGTYTIAVVSGGWTSPASARTVSVTVTQVEQFGGASYAATVSASVTPNTLPVTSTAAGYGPIVILGELTLPLQEIPQDNLECYFTVAITSGQTTDIFMDVLFLDTTGSTVIIESPTAYSNFYIDEPASDRDIGLILGSLYDRDNAVSVLDRATVTGLPLSIDPQGNPYLLAYCAEGAPNMQMHYFARWWLDRYDLGLLERNQSP